MTEQQYEALMRSISLLKEDVDQRFENLESNFKEFKIEFKAYQQGTQWVVQLAFALIASATIAIVVKIALS